MSNNTKQYEHWYLDTSSKFLGTAKMYLDKGIDVRDKTYSTIYTVDNPYEVALLHKYHGSTTHTLSFGNVQLDEDTKTATLSPTVNEIPDDVKAEQLSKFKASFKQECLDLFNITENKGLFIFIHDNNVYTVENNLISVWLTYIFTRKVTMGISNEGELEFKFKEGEYPLYLRNDKDEQIKKLVDASVMDDLYNQYRVFLSRQIEYVSQVYDRIDDYTNEDLYSIFKQMLDNKH